jgi:hypothetical protein
MKKQSFRQPMGKDLLYSMQSIVRVSAAWHSVRPQRMVELGSTYLIDGITE